MKVFICNYPSTQTNDLEVFAKNGYLLEPVAHIEIEDTNSCTRSNRMEAVANWVSEVTAQMEISNSHIFEACGGDEDSMLEDGEMERLSEVSTVTSLYTVEGEGREENAFGSNMRCEQGFEHEGKHSGLERGVLGEGGDNMKLDTDVITDSCGASTRMQHSTEHKHRGGDGIVPSTLGSVPLGAQIFNMTIATVNGRRRWTGAEKWIGSVGNGRRKSPGRFSDNSRRWGWLLG